MHEFRIHTRGLRRWPTLTNMIASSAHPCVALRLAVYMEVAAARYFKFCKLHVLSRRSKLSLADDMDSRTDVGALQLHGGLLSGD